jgi:glucan 1,3-beta-glucosidase
MVSAPIIDYYYTQIIGNPNCLPIIKASSGFTARWVIDGDQYQSNGDLGFGSTNVFFRQIANFIIDTTSVAADVSIAGIHWPTAQATSLQNIAFKLSSASGTQHEGVFIESGSGGLVADLSFQGGLNGLTVGNQQFTMRNLTFSGAVNAINQLWDWGWTYKGLNVNNCQIGYVEFKNFLCLKLTCE